jgi:hypothetical protein
VVAAAAALRVERQRLRDERQRVLAEQQRISRLQAALAMFTVLQGKGNWLVAQANAAPARDSARWAEALGLCRQAVEQTLGLEADEASRRRSRALAAELGAAEEAARRRAEEASAAPPVGAGNGGEPRATPH